MLLADLWTVFFRKVKIAVWAMKIHAGSKHVGIDDEDFLARWTRYLYSLTHFPSWYL
jgi:hypothetical protein